jgi:DNA-directed RNA polymerase subunit M/transcription elongation factor TFIIS
MATFPSIITAFPTAPAFPVFSFQGPTSDQSLQTLAPPPVISTITPQWLINLFTLIPEDQRELLSTLTEQDLVNISQMVYTSGKLVLNMDDSEVTMEVIGFLRKTPVTQLLDEIRLCKDRTDLLWLSSQHRDGFLVVAREVFILQVEESGIKGIVKCRRCQSSNVLMRSQQLRAGDEPTTIFTRCIDCNETWKQ